MVIKKKPLNIKLCTGVKKSKRKLMGETLMKKKVKTDLEKNDTCLKHQVRSWTYQHV